MTLAESQQQAKERIADIVRRQADLAAKVASIEQRLGDALDAASEAALGSPAKFDTPLVAWAKADLLVTVTQWAGDILAIGHSNGEYFRQLATSTKDYLAVQKQAVPLLLARFGLTEAGAIIPGGFFGAFLGDTTLAAQVKQAAWKAKAAGVGLAEFKKQIRTLVAGSSDANGGSTSTGLVTRHFNTFAYDTYQQADAQTQDFYAVKLGLPAALYLGGEIAGTREFCHERQGKVYTRQEIAGWAELEFSGKTPDYNPFTDRGGYNCRHHLHYITARMAASRRSDLYVGTDGKLYRQGEKQPVVVASAAKTAPVEQPPAAVQVEDAPEETTSSQVAVPQKTVAAAERELERLGVASSVSYGKATLAQANELNTLLGDLAAKYDVPAVARLEVIPGGINRLTKTSNGHYDPNGKRAMRFNEKQLLKPNFEGNKDYQKSWQDHAATLLKQKEENPGWFIGTGSVPKRNRAVLKDAQEAAKYERFSTSSSGYSYRGTFVHEYGHAVHDAVTGLYGASSRTNPALLDKLAAGELQAEMQTAYAEAIKSGDIYKISNYARTNVKEFFAESFTMYELEPDKLPAAVKSFLTKYLSHAKR